MKRLRTVVQREEFYDVPDDFILDEESFKALLPNISIINSVQVISTTVIHANKEVEEHI